VELGEDLGGESEASTAIQYNVLNSSYYSLAILPLAKAVSLVVLTSPLCEKLTI